MNNLKPLIDESLALLPTNGLSNPREAEMRSAKLLTAVAALSLEKKNLMDAKVKATSEYSVIMNTLMNGNTSKTVTEKKSQSEASPQGIMVREAVESIDNEISYIKALMDVFNNGALLLRQMGRGEL